MIPDFVVAGANPYLAFPPAYRTTLSAAVLGGQLDFIKGLSKQSISFTEKVKQADAKGEVSTSPASLLEFADAAGNRPLALAALHAHPDIC